jgi:cell wall-active antibiotic response 4TMS protein YvqF
MTYVGEGRRISRLIGGGLLLLVGLLFALQNLGMVHAGRLGDYWPLFIVWIGLCRMLGPGRARHFVSGLMLFLVGVFLQLVELDVVWVPVRLLWPILLIVVGFGLIGESLIARRGGGGTGPTPAARADLEGRP